ncbi:cytochrome P450- family 76- subfamily G-polypeptide 1 [Striga hermonthica]|uniref:Cytochrome P450- family 76- subfamily G-polypeptide 1 n=1 Tax=Striga hermonthica TaxID=68872 RepID=A0A9N7RGK3_STRHE|nr:cytochrome P450- family 76- subfamily G-polypeptide 1 [Striga hermonthica]
MGSWGLAGLILALFLFATWAAAADRRRRRLPPGPRPWPLLGNIPQLAGGGASAPHRSLAGLARRHGAVMTLHLGAMTTVVISSSAAARAALRRHDAALAGRQIYDSMRGEVGNEGSLITAQYGPRWRALRRLCTAEFFAAAPLDAMRGVREGCAARMVDHIRAAAAAGGGIDVGRFFFLMAFNLIGNLIFSKDLLGPESERGSEFFYHAGKATEFAGKPNVADFWPVLRRVDPQGIRRRTQFHVKRAFDVAGEFLRERMSETANGSGLGKKNEKKDYLDVLLDYKGCGFEEGVNGFSSTVINVIVFEMFTAGTDTTTSTLEWAMAELLHNPETLHRAQTELRATIRPGKKLDERELDQLPYLNAIIKETLRLHPPLPFLVPHKALESCEIQGFHVPKETQVLVNVWAIGRDPTIWKDPLRFKPNRFLEPDVPDYKGQHFEFIPFGSGRRMCPAVPLASRILPLALGSVLYFFDWVLEDGKKGEEMDMKERMGITLRKDVPLRAIPIPYEGV